MHSSANDKVKEDGKTLLCHWFSRLLCSLRDKTSVFCASTNCSRIMDTYGMFVSYAFYIYLQLTFETNCMFFFLNLYIYLLILFIQDACRLEQLRAMAALCSPSHFLPILNGRISKPIGL